MGADRKIWNLPLARKAGCQLSSYQGLENKEVTFVASNFRLFHVEPST